MKRKFTIMVDIDTDREGPSEVVAIDEKGQEGVHREKDHVANEYLVRISDDSVLVRDKAHVLAHELGHIVAWVFDLPGTKRMRVARQADFYLTRYAEEQEAWDMAERMFRFVADKRAALHTYEQRIPDYHLRTPSFKLLGDK